MENIMKQQSTKSHTFHHITNDANCLHLVNTEIPFQSKKTKQKKKKDSLDITLASFV
jgi:hypothetical protein